MTAEGGERAAVLKMAKAELIEFIVAAAAARGEIHLLGFAGWSKDELQREALDHVDPSAPDCTSEWHHIRPIKRAPRCPHCGEESQP